VSAFHQTQHLLCQRYTVRSVLRQQRDLEIRLAHIVGKSGQAGQRRRHLRSDLAVVAVSALAFGYADDREIRSASAHRELHRHAQYVVGSKQRLCSRGIHGHNTARGIIIRRVPKAPRLQRSRKHQKHAAVARRKAGAYFSLWAAHTSAGAAGHRHARNAFHTAHGLHVPVGKIIVHSGILAGHTQIHRTGRQHAQFAVHHPLPAAADAQHHNDSPNADDDAQHREK